MSLDMAACADMRPATPPPASEQEAFEPWDWGLLALPALAWGASFVFMAVGLDHLAPGLITFGRLAFGAATLALFPAARRAVPREAWPRIAVFGLIWMAVPWVLFPVAQQWIDSSLAGMLNGSVPLWTAAVAAVLARRLPRAQQAGGLLLGFLGVVALSLPALGASQSTALGALLVVAATLCYGVAFNLAVPLQRSYGALPIMLRAQVVSLVAVLPFAAVGLPASTFAWSSVAAVVALGVGSSGLAMAAITELAGRRGAARSSVTVYFPPVVAIALGVTFRGDIVHPAQLAGTVLVLLGAWITSRGQRPALRPAPAGVAVSEPPAEASRSAPS